MSVRGGFFRRDFSSSQCFDGGIILSAVKGKSLRDGLRPPLTAARDDAFFINIEKMKNCQLGDPGDLGKSVTYVPERLSPMCPV